MKKVLLLILAITVIVSACKEVDPESYKINLENLSPFIEKKAPVKEGFTTIIKADTTIICQTNIEMNYFLPKGKSQTIEYIPSKKSVVYGGWSSYHFTACFEDTRNGDNDYNDFACFITVIQDFWLTNNTSKLVFYVQPLAYGAGTNLQFGITLPDGRDTMITNNVRRDFFPGTTGFVNTVNPKDEFYQTGDINHIKKYEFILPGNANNINFRIHPFIINESGDKLYVALNGYYIPADYTSIVSTTGYPLGIATEGAFAYPKEKENINNCYSNYNNWVLGNNTSIGYYTNQLNVLYKIGWQIKDGGLIYYNPQNLNWN